ncbi:MAG TPA: acyl-CoA dehydrogenase family protein [Gaiellaceae bacterium]|nr:acyl-CoA dehydrogenase family protein [Gaiellaceae bacterium]
MESFYDARLGDDPRLREFGATVAQVIEPAVAELEARRDLPATDGEGVEFHPAYSTAGRAVWASGVLGAGASDQAALLYLLAHVGEGGHACPVVCTAGLIRALRREASPELRERFLPPLLETDYDRAQRGAQFLTERHGGSDVGANRVEAVRDGEAWRLSGEKWFCSVADADQFVVTARPRGAPDGTRGIGCFLVPRRVDGSVNGFRIRRLKDKLGTRALATGEIEFEGALALPIGELEDGFRIAAGVVLNTSRWLNALGSAGLMRRAYLEASTFARERTAFGRPIAEFPLVRENLAVMKAEEQAAFASTHELTQLVEKIDAGTASDDDVTWHRILVNANKFVTSLAATRVARRAIETLGGNGTIEDFSPLPRLYRDAIVFESWEGTHNVLCIQVLRDLGRLDALTLVIQRVRGISEAGILDEALTDLEHRLRLSIATPQHGARHVRRQLDVLVHTLQTACLLRDGAPAADMLIRRHLTTGWDPETDTGYDDAIDAVLGDDA